MEYRVDVRCLEIGDLREGARAVLITKDNKPKWNPSRIEDVTDEHVLSFLRPMPKNEDFPM